MIHITFSSHGCALDSAWLKSVPCNTDGIGNLHFLWDFFFIWSPLLYNQQVLYIKEERRPYCKIITDLDMVLCCKCSEWYHIHCLPVPPVYSHTEGSSVEWFHHSCVQANCCAFMHTTNNNISKVVSVVVCSKYFSGEQIFTLSLSLRNKLRWQPPIYIPKQQNWQISHTYMLGVTVTCFCLYQTPRSGNTTKQNSPPLLSPCLIFYAWG